MALLLFVAIGYGPEVRLGFEPIPEKSAADSPGTNPTQVFPGVLRESTIGLDDALRLAGAQSPMIALASETVRAAEAEQLLIRAQLLPTLDAGMNYRNHSGRLLDNQGRFFDDNLQSLYYGFGADAKGSGTVAVPGIWLSAHLGDAILAPRAAAQFVVGRRFDAEAQGNGVLLDVVMRYLTLAGAQARVNAYRESIGDVEKIVVLTSNFAKTGQGREADSRRAQSESYLLRADLDRAGEEVEVAAAELARTLSVDPSNRLRPIDATPPLLNWVDVDSPIEELLAIALANNPEIMARSADIAYQEIRLRQERIRPWLPRIIAGASAGEFGGGSNLVTPRFGNFQSRTDFDVMAVWTVENFGFGNRARQNRANSELGQAQASRSIALDRLRAEVAESLALLRARSREMDLARRRVNAAQSAYQLDLLRTRNIEGRPIEALSSATTLSAARQEFLQAAVGYSQAQVRMVVALGKSPTASH